MFVKTFSFYADDTSLESLGKIIEQKLNAELVDLKDKVVSLQIVPIKTHYSTPEEGSYRDFHYNESGLIAVILCRD